MDVVRTDAGSVGGPQTRPPLSRDLIISRAIDMADTAGVASISMRKLGQELGVEAMSLYHYVNGREDLLEGIVDRLVGQIPTQPDGALHPSDSWQAFLQWFAHSVRDVATQHPLLFPLIATRHPAATWLRPPLRSIRLVEGFFEAVTERGLTDRQAVMVYRSFTSFLLGHLLLETVNLGATTSPVDQPLDEGDAQTPTRDTGLDLSDYPLVNALRSALTEDHSAAEFEAGLEALLDRLDLHLSQ